MALDFGAGCAGGMAGILVGYPLDTVKVRIQTQDPTNLKYRGTFQCLSSIIKDEGGRALYRGMSGPLASVAAINAIGFGVYGNVSRRLQNPDVVQSAAIAGCASGFVQAFVASPMELVKTQMQVRPECNKVSDTVKSIVERAGYKGLLRGLGTTIVREVPAVGIYFSSFEVFSKLRQDSEAWIFVSGGLAGIASWVFTYPQDVVKSRLQADAFGKDASYRGPWHCFKASLAAEGPKMLFRGMGSTVIRAFPVNGATMAVYYLIMQAFSEEKVEVKQAVRRVRMAESFYVDLPTVDRYFAHKLYSYHHNVSTIVTDGPDIIHIRNNLPLNLSRVHVESALYSMQTVRRIEDEKSVEIGTIRSSGVTLQMLIRFFERSFGLGRYRDDTSDDYELFWTKEKAFMNKTCDFHIDSDSGVPLKVEEDNIKKDIIEETIDFNKPSLLEANEAPEKLTTADFFLPTGLTANPSNNDSKIYGFYYLTQ